MYIIKKKTRQLGLLGSWPPFLYYIYIFYFYIFYYIFLILGEGGGGKGASDMCCELGPTKKKEKKTPPTKQNPGGKSF